MLFLYDLIFAFALVLSSPYLLPKVLLGGHGLRERLGLWPEDIFRRRESSATLWVHAASVGEVHSLGAFLPALRRQFPQHHFILSVTTKAGRERALQLMDDIDGIFYVPIDLSISVRRVLRVVDPDVLVLTETELWPNLIIRSHQSGVKVVLVNGRISPRSLSRYRLIAGLMSRVLASVDLLCVQTAEDAARFGALGADHRRLKVTGNFKSDLLFSSTMRGERESVRTSLGIPPQARVLVAGSTRPGEEEKLLEPLVSLRDSFSPLRAIVAPRHIQRAPKVARLMESGGLRVQRLSQLETSPPSPWDILVVDSLGQLMRLYSAADVAFVGGSLLPYGGHNPLEPASYGIPVLFGPYMDHCQRSAQLLMDSGGGIRVEDGPGMKEAISLLLRSPEERNRRGGAALHVVRQERGAAERTAQALSQTLL